MYIIQRGPAALGHGRQESLRQTGPPPQGTPSPSCARPTGRFVPCHWLGSDAMLREIPVPGLAVGLSLFPVCSTSPPSYRRDLPGTLVGMLPSHLLSFFLLPNQHVLPSAPHHLLIPLKTDTATRAHDLPLQLPVIRPHSGMPHQLHRVRQDAQGGHGTERSR